MTPKEISEIDQGGKLLADILPPLWRGLYVGCKEQGFDDEQAFELVKTYIRASWNTGDDE